MLQQREDSPEVLLCGQKTPSTWGLPKGTPNPGEKVEETARREVQEETGLQVEVRQKVGSVHYWFARGGVRYHKTVHFFLMVPTGGSLDLHDPEFDLVQWFPAPQALRTLSYRNEAAIVEKALALFQEGTGGREEG